MTRKKQMTGSSAMRAHVPCGDPADDDANSQPPPVPCERHPAYQFIAVDHWHQWKR
jgi:hypothetical protein